MLKDDILREMQRRQRLIPQGITMRQYHTDCVAIMFEVAAEVLAALPAAMPVYATSPKP